MVIITTMIIVIIRMVVIKGMIVNFLDAYRIKNDLSCASTDRAILLIPTLILIVVITLILIFTPIIILRTTSNYQHDHVHSFLHVC